MAKQLSMEDLIKKYQYLKANQQTSPPTTETNSKTQKTDRTVDAECSKSSSISHDKTGTSARSMSFESSSQPTSSEDTCKVCLDAVANCAFIECGHIVTCLDCAKLLTKCPVCRETIKRTLRVYKS